MGVIFFIYNAVFSTVLLLIVLVASIIAVVAKNPDTRYQPMRDDRGSFIKSQNGLNTELDALGATARGESKHGRINKSGARFEEDEDSWSGGSSDRAAQQPTAYQGAAGYAQESGNGRHMPVSHHNGQSASPYENSRPESLASDNRFRQQGASPSPWQRGAGYE